MNSKRFNKLIKKMQIDNAAFDELYNYYFPKIPRHIFRKYNNVNLGEDIAQDCFAKLLKMEVKSYIDNPNSWIYTICDNIFIDLLKKRGLDLLIPSDEAQLLAKSAFVQEVYGEYWDKLKNLDKETREIIIMHLWEGYDLNEIAVDLKLNYNTVRQKYSRGLKNLKKY